VNWKREDFERAVHREGDREENNAKRSNEEEKEKLTIIRNPIKDY
jgi:hypothetical protein